MTVIDTRQDPEMLSLTITAEFTAPVERVWAMWENPRLLERWWGPPTHPATFVDHDLTPGGAVTYFMTAPDGEKYRGWWRIVAIDAPRRLELEDGFADVDGNPDPDLPTTVMVAELTEQPGGVTRMTIVSTFPSRAAMDQIVSMGVVEGMTQALGQIDELLRVPA